MLVIIPVILMSFKVTFLCFFFCFPVILGNGFFLLSLPIVIIYPFEFVIYFFVGYYCFILPVYLDISLLTSFPNVGHVFLFPFYSDLLMIVVLVIFLAQIFALGVHLLVACCWPCICSLQILEGLSLHSSL